jgi:lycopene cyclase domain-containing protein
MERPALSFGYLAALLLSLLGLALIDHRHKLAFFVNWRRAALSVSVPVFFFLAWDAFGIILGIFFRGQTEHLTGVLLAPELPLEEVFFLLLLTYTSLVVFLLVQRYGANRKVRSEEK